MSTIHLIVGSMLGGTEYVAEAVEQVLAENAFKTKLHFQPDFDDLDKNNTTWLICTSTHGAGDLPDNIQAFAAALEQYRQDLSTVRFLVIATGDSSYDTFCQAGKSIEKLMLSKGCLQISSNLYLDMQQDIDPEDVAQDWIRSQIHKF